MNCMHYLTDVLDFLKEKSMAKPGYGNTAKGTTATLPVNALAKNLLRSWLLKPITTIVEVDGEPQEM
nr:MAG TPA: MutS domain III [Bacteriophage sp.]